MAAALPIVKIIEKDSPADLNSALLAFLPTVEPNSRMGDPVQRNDIETDNGNKLHTAVIYYNTIT